MDNSICTDCTCRYICGLSDRCAADNKKFLSKIEHVILRDLLTKCVIDCKFFKKDNSIKGD